jgi:hypothetical protein
MSSTDAGSRRLGRVAVTPVTVEVRAVADESKVAPALCAYVERARRDGVHLTVRGPVAV